MNGLAQTRCVHRAVAAFEFVHPTGGIDKFLFAREKRMASGANADLDVVSGRASAIRSATGASDHGFDVVGMNV